MGIYAAAAVIRSIRCNSTLAQYREPGKSWRSREPSEVKEQLQSRAPAAAWEGRTHQSLIGRQSMGLTDLALLSCNEIWTTAGMDGHSPHRSTRGLAVAG
jgi:hypothetical protein